MKEMLWCLYNRQHLNHFFPVGGEVEYKSEKVMENKNVNPDDLGSFFPNPRKQSVKIIIVKLDKI